MSNAQARVNTRISAILGSEIIKIIHLSGSFLIFDPESIVRCMKINIHVELIGPSVRLLVSDKTSLPGLLTPYQAALLIPSSNVEVFDEAEVVNKDQLAAFEETFYLNLERNVKKHHLELAKSFGQEVDIPSELEKMTSMPAEVRRWRVNFPDHGSLFVEDASRLSKLPEIKGLDMVKEKCHRYLWESGYYLTSGMKYGCDWLAYEHPPDLVHAAYIVSVFDGDQKLRPSDIAGRSRIATKSKKKWLLMSVINDAVEASVIGWSHRRY